MGTSSTRAATGRPTPTADDDLALARAGDDAAFARLVGPLRRELHAHCYRMLGAAHDADDALQETLLKAWRALAGFEGRSSVRSWLYTIATRACLDAAQARGRRALPMDLGPASEHAVVGDRPRADVAWLGPYPDDAAPAGADPAGHLERLEAVELAFVAALQHLPGNQRAALLLVEVLGFTPAEVAAMMATSTAAVNSALQRARAQLARDPATDPASAPATDRVRRAAAARFADALERGDADALVALLTADVTWSMPPLPHWYAGLAAVSDFARRVPLGGCGDWRHLPVVANGTPALALYLRPPDADPGAPHDAWAVTVLDVRDDGVAGLTTFIGGEHHARFGLPPSMP